METTLFYLYLKIVNWHLLILKSFLLVFSTGMNIFIFQGSEVDILKEEDSLQSFSTTATPLTMSKIVTVHLKEFFLKHIKNHDGWILIWFWNIFILQNLNSHSGLGFFYQINIMGSYCFGLFWPK